MENYYFNPILFPRLLRKSRLYELSDFSIKLIISTAFCFFLYIFHPINFLIAIIVSLLILKLLWWSTIQIALLILKKQFCWNMVKLKEIKTKTEKVGNFNSEDVHRWIVELCGEMNIRVPVEMVVYDTKYANAFAAKEKFLFFLSKNRIGIYSNLFHILKEDELRSVIAHELGHYKNYRRIKSLYWIFPPLIFHLFDYFRCQEHLADYYAAKFVSVLSTANALIKLYQRNYLISEISKRLIYVQKKFNIGPEGIAEMNQELERILPHNLNEEESFVSYFEQVVDNYFLKRSSKFEGIAKEFIQEYDISAKEEAQKLKEVYYLLDWRIFDNRIRDNHLDEEELVSFYLYLKGDKKAIMNIDYAFADKSLEKFTTHASLKDRLIFIIESVGMK